MYVPQLSMSVCLVRYVGGDLTQQRSLPRVVKDRYCVSAEEVVMKLMIVLARSILINSVRLYCFLTQLRSCNHMTGRRPCHPFTHVAIANPADFSSRFSLFFTSDREGDPNSRSRSTWYSCSVDYSSCSKLEWLLITSIELCIRLHNGQPPQPVWRR